jgi:hypothetical protein
MGSQPTRATRDASGRSSESSSSSTCFRAYFGLPKCRFIPSQEGEWLGFEVVTQEEEFRVSSKKMQKVLAALSLLIKATSVSPRQLAAVAGKLISLSPAVLPASLYSREFFQAIQGKISWDEIFATLESPSEKRPRSGLRISPIGTAESGTLSPSPHRFRPMHRTSVMERKSFYQMGSRFRSRVTFLSKKWALPARPERPGLPLPDGSHL